MATTTIEVPPEVLTDRELRTRIPHAKRMLLVRDVELGISEDVLAVSKPRGVLSDWPYDTKPDWKGRIGNTTYGKKLLSHDDPGNPGHFPPPIGPRNPMNDQLAIGIEVAKHHVGGGSLQVAEIADLRVWAPVVPGDFLHIAATSNPKNGYMIDLHESIRDGTEVLSGSVMLASVDPAGQYMLPYALLECMLQTAACAGMSSGQLGSLPAAGGSRIMKFVRPIRVDEPIQFVVGPMQFRFGSGNALGNCTVSTWLLNKDGKRVKELASGQASFALLS